MAAFCSWGRKLRLTFDLTQAVVGCLGAQLLFNTQQLVVLGNTVRAAQRAGLDLAGAGGDREISDGGVFGFTRAVGDHSSVAGILGHLDGVEGFGQAADLVELDQDGVAHTLFNAFLEDCLLYTSPSPRD